MTTSFEQKSLSDYGQRIAASIAAGNNCPVNSFTFIEALTQEINNVDGCIESNARYHDELLSLLDWFRNEYPLIGQ